MLNFDDKMMIKTIRNDVTEIDKMLIGGTERAVFEKVFKDLASGKNDIEKLLDVEPPVPEFRRYLELRIKNFDDLSFALGLIMQGEEMMKHAVEKFKKAAAGLIDEVETRCGEKYIPEETGSLPFESTGNEEVDKFLATIYSAFTDIMNQAANNADEEKGEQEDA